MNRDHDAVTFEEHRSDSGLSRVIASILGCRLDHSMRGDRRRHGAAFVVLLSAALGLLASVVSLGIELQHPGFGQYAADYILAVFALVSGAVTGLTAGVVGGAFGWLGILLFRRLRLPPSVGLLLGAAGAGGSLALWFVSDFTGSFDAATQFVPIPAMCGGVVLTAAWVLVVRREHEARDGRSVLMVEGSIEDALPVDDLT